VGRKQEASAATRAKVQFLAVVGPQTEQNALPYLTSLALRHCDVVLAVGPAQVAAVAAGAPRFPTVRFVVIGDGAQGANVSQVASSQRDEVRLAVKAAVVPLVGDR
jgi:basic membrane lipoprotein Med (substrate-binding protein (PBP1-ABC) superfamily)